MGSGAGFHLIDIGNSPVNNVVSAVGGAGGAVAISTGVPPALAVAASVTNVVAGVAGVLYVSALAYQFYDSKDDHRLLTKLGMKDCGGLSQMPAKIEGCYRKYVGKAIHRMNASLNYRTFYDRFIECFSERPELSCGWFGEDIFATGK